jgi:hypothetical protein
VGTHQTEVSSKPKRRFLRFLVYTVLSFLFLTGGLLGAIFYYEDEIKAAIIKELNKNLKAEVKIDPKDIDVTILSSFPDCALRFRNVLMYEALKKKNRDTLLFAGKLDLHFDFLDMWRDKYEIHKLSITNCIIKPLVNSKGQNNYTFWQAHEQNSTSNSGFRLNDVRIRKARIIYKNEESRVVTDLVVSKLDLCGDFSSDQYDIDAKADLLMHKLTVNGSSYATEKNIDASVALKVRGDAYTLGRSSVRVNELGLTLEGGFTVKDDNLKTLNIRYNAADLDIQSLLSLLPDVYKSKMNGYESSGTLYAQGNIMWMGNRLAAAGDFGAKNAVVMYVPENTKARNINFKGSFSYGDENFIEVQGLGLDLEAGSVKGSFRLDGRENQELLLEAEANTDLATLNRFFPIDTLQKISGHLRLDVRLRGHLAALQSKEPNEKIMVRVQAQVNNLETQFKHDDKAYKIANCLLKADDQEIEVRNLVLYRGSSDVTINGKLPGFIKYLFGKPVPLRIEGTLKSTQLVVNDFVPVEKGNVTTSSPAIIPANLVLSVSSSIDKFSFGKFEATEVSGLMEIRDQKLFLSETNLRTLQGSAAINALADNSHGKLDVWVECSLKRINIRELFRQMNNFGQTTLQENHIKGFATAELKFMGTWNSALESQPSSIRSTCELEIDKGELMGFSPLLSLARFVDVKELEHIRFGQLTSRIEIAGEKIVIPRTSIKNSAINLEYWGSHTFNHDIDYHFQLLTADLLRARKNKAPKEEEFGPVARDPDNTRSVFIVMSGNLDNPKIRYDKQGMQQKIRGDLKKERENLKGLIREEFGFNKKEGVKSDRGEESSQTLKLEETEKKPAKKELVLKKKEEDDF